MKLPMPAEWENEIDYPRARREAEAAFWSRILGKPVAAVYKGIAIIEMEDLGMGAREMRDAFNLAAAPAATCIKALLEYEHANDTEWQVIFFSGNYADGSGFAIKSDRIRPGGDISQMVTATAERVLQQKGTA